MRHARFSFALLALLPAVFAFAATAQAQIETVVVTAHFAGPRAEKFLTAASKRLTPEGNAFVERDAKLVYDGDVDIEAARTEAEQNCDKAFESCGDRDAAALTVLVLEHALGHSLPDEEHLLSGIPQSHFAHVFEQIQACQQRNDEKCARKVFLNSLPAERRPAFESLARRLRHIRRGLNRVLASAGFDQKDDR